MTQRRQLLNGDAADMPRRWPPSRPALAALAAAVVTAAVFYPVCFHEFVRWDDPHNFINNPRMHSPSLRDVAWYWHNAYAHLYVPVTYTLWTAVGCVARTGGALPQELQLNAYVFHALNLLVHLASAALVCRILLKMGASAAAAAFGAVFFAVHPVQVEAVAWASGTKDLLAGMFGLAAICTFAFTPDPRIASRQYLQSTALFALAMLSKPSAVVVPLVTAALALVYDNQHMRQRLRRLAWPMALWLVLAVPVVIIGRLVQPAESLRFVPPAWSRPVIAADALAFYLGKIAAPVHLAIDYGRSPQHVLSSGTVWITVPAALLTGAVVVIVRRWWAAPAAGAAVLAAGVLPVLGLVSFDFQSYSTVADHYLYLPMLGPAIVLAGAIDRWRNTLVLAICAAALAALAARSRIQAEVWRDSRTLFEHTLKVNPDSRAAGVNLATELAAEAHMLASAGRAEEAIAMYDRAVALDRHVLEKFPWDPHARRALAEMHTARGAIIAALLKDLPRAVGEFEEALRYDPQYVPARENLEKARRLLRRTDR